MVSMGNQLTKRIWHVKRKDFPLMHIDLEIFTTVIDVRFSAVLYDCQESQENFQGTYSLGIEQNYNSYWYHLILKCW